MLKRTFLKSGTRLKLSYGNTYEIVGQPIGNGGGSVVYQCKKILEKDGKIVYDGILYALKECYPASSGHVFVRDSNWEIVPENNNVESALFLQHIKEMQLLEQELTQSIYRTASRMLPIVESSEKAEIQISQAGEDGSEGYVTTTAHNVYTVMESLSSKGRSLHSYIEEYGSFSPVQAFQVARQLLFSLREIHQAGFLHLDIQDGNIFLNGTLERGDDSEILTLIDFGCARKMIDGKTEPITDKVIFTTQGFSAPEILLHNDGSLCLGAEADIYSVGCLLLYLLTGKKYDENYLIHNTTGKYLTNFKLRKIACPKHLIDRMQEIIAHALETDPDKRYHSADEMLEDVSDFIKALQPYRSDLASVSYDAFICYKHGDIDSAAARTLQQRLEHFRVSKKISGNTHPFRRVFVDEGELSSCADFGEQVRAALQNSGWLIVICSRETPLSPWVKLEIDTFLKYHDRSRILAVLTDGEPEDSFPEKLLEGTEVLAADARGNNKQEVVKKLKGDSLLKLVAPMLGVTFDTLKQRQRTYRYQKIAAAMSVLTVAAVLFSVYAYKQTSTISKQANELEEEYRQTLISQSEYLVENAENEIADNNIVGALDSLVRALPSESEDRPLVTDAEYMLTDLLNTYKTPADVSDSVTVVDYLDFVDDNSITWAWAFDPDNKYMFLADSYTIWVRSAEDFRLIQTIDLSDKGILKNFSSADFIVTEDGRIITWIGESVCCMDYMSGEYVWEIPSLVEEDSDSGMSMILSEDGSQVAVVTLGEISILDVASGASVYELKYDVCVNQEITDADGNVQESVEGGEVVWSSDGRYLAFYTRQYNSNNNLYPASVYIADLESQSVVVTDFDVEKLRKIWFCDNKLYVLDDTSQSGTADRINVETEGTVSICKVDIDSGSQIWNVSKSSIGLSNFVDMEIRESPYDSFADGKVLFVVVDSMFMAISVDDGKLIQENVYASPIKAVEYSDETIYTVHEDGTYSCIAINDGYEKKQVLSQEWFADNIIHVYQIGDYFYVMIQKNPGVYYNCSIIKYQLEKQGDGYKEIMENSEDSSTSYSVIRAGWTYSYDKGNDFVKIMDCVHGNTYTIELQSIDGTMPEDYYNFELLGISEDESELAFEVSIEDAEWNTQYYVYRIDLATQTSKVEKININENEFFEEMLYYDKAVFYITDGKTTRSYDSSLADNGKVEYSSYNKINVYAMYDGENSQLLKQIKLEENDIDYTIGNVGEDAAEEDSETIEVLEASEAYLGHTLVYDSDAGILSLGVYEQGNHASARFIDLNINTLKSQEISLENMDMQGVWYAEKYVVNKDRSYRAVCRDCYSDENGYISEVTVFDETGSVIYEYSGENQTVENLFFSNSDENSLFMVIYNDVNFGYQLTRIDLENSGWTDIISVGYITADTYANLYDSRVDWISDDSFLIYSGEYKGTGYVIKENGDLTGMVACVNGCLGYCEDQGKIFATFVTDDSDSVRKWGSFDYVPLEELVEQANAVLNQH